jgi:uncharacterized protein (TIGR02444 family)
MTAPSDALDHPFWTYSLSVYGSDGVPAELIALQDTFDIDVNIALFCLWIGREMGTVLDSEQIESIGVRCSSWNRETIAPMRSVRRYLKSGTAIQPVAQRAAELRSQVKRLELLAEQIEQALLYDWFVETRPARGKGEESAAIHNLTLLMQRTVPGWSPDHTAKAYAATLGASQRSFSKNPAPGANG